MRAPGPEIGSSEAIEFTRNHVRVNALKSHGSKMMRELGVIESAARELPHSSSPSANRAPW